MPRHVSQPPALGRVAKGSLIAAALLVVAQVDSVRAADNRLEKKSRSAGSRATPASRRVAAAKPETPPTDYIDVPIVSLLRSDRVLEELKLAPAQATQIDAALSLVDRPLFLLRNVPAQTGAGKQRELLAQLDERLAPLLEAAQRERLDQLIFRAVGFPAILYPKNIAALGLDERQVQAIETAIADAQRRLQELQKSGAQTNASQQAQEKVRERVMEILSPEQAQQLSKLVGAPFDLSQVRQVACRAPELAGVEGWLNSPPLALDKLRGKVVALHFYAFGCINCVHNFEWYKAWHEKYAARDLVVLGVHTPETSPERSFANVESKAREAGFKFPIAVDAQSQTWNAWGNTMWPAVYLIDRRGYVRYWWTGELKWQGTDGEAITRRRIEELLEESAGQGSP